MAAPTLTDLNWLAIAIAMVWNFVLGFVWYAQFTPTGRIWMRAQGIGPDHKPAPGEMAKGLVLMVVGSLLTMGVLAYLIEAVTAFYGSPPDWMGGLYAGFFVWLGFFLPQHLGGMAWERKGLPVTAVNGGYNLLNLLVSGAIIAAMSA
jgi:hypothetical protein